MITIIVPCWNAAATISPTLLSIPGLSSNEVIVVDDGSTDHSAQIVTQCKQGAILLRGPNQGVSRARNRGIRHASHDWIQFLDSDDLLAPGTLERRLQVAEQTCADVVITDWLPFAQESELEPPATEHRRTADWPRLHAQGAEIACATSFWAPPAAILFRRTLVEKIGGFRNDLPVIQDARFLFDAACHGARFVHLPEVGAYYRVAPASLSRSNPARFWLDCLRNGQQIEEHWMATAPHDQARRAALVEIFSGVANALVRLGHRQTHAAVDGILRNGGRLSRELRCGLVLQRVLGPQPTAMLFQAGRSGRGAARGLVSRLKETQG